MVAIKPPTTTIQTEYRGTQFLVRDVETGLSFQLFNAVYSPHFIMGRNVGRASIGTSHLMFTATDSFRQARLSGIGAGNSIYNDFKIY